MRTKEYWIEWTKRAGMRALKTMAQTFIASVGSTALFTEVNWIVVGSTVLLAGVLSVATSVAGLPEVPEGE